jgi:hypothetical protein
MTTEPVVSQRTAEAEPASFTASVLSLMRALLAAQDPGVDAGARLPQARLGDPATGGYDVVRSPHIRVDI